MLGSRVRHRREFHPGVPAAATHITISPPDGDVITVRVRT